MKKYVGFLILPFLILFHSCEESGNETGNNGKISNPDGAPVLTCKDFTDDITLEDEPGRDVDYIIDCLVEVEDIEIEIFDGAVIEFTEGSGIIFKDESTLSFYALEGVVPHVILRGNKSEPGYWKGIRVESDKMNNVIQGVEIYDAGSKTDPMFYGAVTVAGGVQIRGSKISKSANYGVYYEDEIGLFQTFSSVEITNCESYPVRIGFKDVGELAGKWPGTDSEEPLNSYSGNNPDRIKVISQPLTKGTTFRDQGIPFEIGETLIADEHVGIEDNVEIVFKVNTRLIIKGQITAWDNGGDPIIMRSNDGIAGGWLGIYIDTETGPLSAGSRIDNVMIKEGGGDADMKANIAIENGDVLVQNCTISNSAGCGIKYIVPQTSLFESNNLFIDNSEGSICEIN